MTKNHRVFAFRIKQLQKQIDRKGALCNNASSVEQTEQQMGYTHRITFDVKTKVCKIWVSSSFPTTADAVNAHMHGLNRNKNVRNVKVEVMKK
jgi:hypothetical protein